MAIFNLEIMFYMYIFDRGNALHFSITKYFHTLYMLICIGLSLGIWYYAALQSQKRQYLLILQVSRYCLLALPRSYDIR